MKKIPALIAGTFMTFAASLVFPIVTHAADALAWTKWDYEQGKEVDAGFTTAFSFTTDNEDSILSEKYGNVDYANDYYALHPEEAASAASNGFDYEDALYLEFSAYGTFHQGDKIYFAFPHEVREIIDFYGYYNWSTVSYDNKGVTLVATTDTPECTYSFTYYKAKAQAAQASEKFWEAPLEDKLNAAVASTDKKVVEYAGDFALSYDTMKFLKEHPEITLKYTMTINGEKKTAVIGGANVIADQNIKWYGVEYLYANYGENAVAANGVAVNGEYIIKPGDTLSKIAAKFGTTVKALAAKNNISNVNLIKAGRKLIL